MSDGDDLDTHDKIIIFFSRLDTHDIIIILFSILVSLILFFYRENTFDLICIFVSHLFIIPSFVILYKSKSWWLFIFVFFSLLASILWHISKQWFYEEDLLKLDIIHQNLLIALSISLIVFKHVPRFMIGILYTYTIILSLWCLDTLWGVDVYIICSGIWIFIFIGHIIYAMNNDSKPNYTYLVCMLIYTITAVLLYEEASGKDYNSIHSIWHVLAYTSLYFSFKMAFKIEKGGEIVEERTDFNLDKQKLLF